MNFPFVTLLIYAININLKYTDARAILPRDYRPSSPLSPASYDKEDGMNENSDRLHLDPTISVKPPKDAENLDSIPSLDADKEQQYFQRKPIVLSSLNFSIRVEDESKDHNTILIPIVLSLQNHEPDASATPIISNSEIKPSIISGDQEDASRNDSGLLVSHSSGRDYFLVSLLSPNISDEGTHAHPTNWTVLIIARHISNPERIDLTWILVGIIALICLLLAATCPIILAYCDYFGGGREDEENMVVDLITPFRHQDYPSEIRKEDSDFRSLGPGRATKLADIDQPLKLNRRGPIAGESKNPKNKENCFGEVDHDGDGISLNDFKICQARKMINLQPFRPSGHPYNDKTSSDSLGSPTATSTSSFTANNPVSPLTTITSPTSFQSLAFSDYHSPLPSLPKKCATT